MIFVSTKSLCLGASLKTPFNFIIEMIYSYFLQELRWPTAKKREIRSTIPGAKYEVFCEEMQGMNETV